MALVPMEVVLVVWGSHLRCCKIKHFVVCERVKRFMRKEPHFLRRFRLTSLPHNLPPCHCLTHTHTHTGRNQSSSPSSLSRTCAHTHINRRALPSTFLRNRKGTRGQGVREGGHNILCDPAFTSLPSLLPPASHGIMGNK